MKRIKLFEEFLNEHKPTEHMSFDEIKAMKDSMREKGEYVKYIGKAESVAKFLKSLSMLSSPWVESDSPTEVKVFNTPDEDSKHEIEDMIGEYGLGRIDLNSLTEDQLKLFPTGGELKVVQDLVHSPQSNVGWNNFDPDVSNGYKFKPGNWRGMYYMLYLISNEEAGEDQYGYTEPKTISDKNPINKGIGKLVVMTNDNRLKDVPKLTEEFEKAFVNTHGSIKVVDVNEEFKILRYKTWWQGHESEWITYDPAKATKPKNIY